MTHHWQLQAVLRIRYVYPGSWSSSIPDLGSRIQQEQESGENSFLSYLSWSHKFHKIVKYFIFEKVPKILSQSTNNLSISNPKNFY